MTDPSSWRHPFPFDPTYGYDLGALRRVAPPERPPADFSAFWTGLYRRTRQTVAVRPQTGPRYRRTAAGLDLHRIRFGSLGGVRLGGWLAVPSDGRVERGLVISHGYNGRGEPDAVLPVPRAAAIFPVARGLPAVSLLPDIPSTGHDHVLTGIGSRDTYVHAGCAADVWCAATALLELVPDAAGRLDYVGASFGGGIGALALPWDERFHRAHLTVPSFGHHPLRVTLPCTGSGEAVRGRHATQPDVLDVLAYFDAATAAGHLRIPTQVCPALFDPSVPPPGQFAVFNALSGPKELHVLTAGHYEDFPEAAAEEEGMRAALRRFLA